MANIRFKDYLKDYLEANNITNKDFAKRIGITQKHLIDILSGKENISSIVAENISLVTDIPIDYILKVELNYKFEKSIEAYLQENNYTITEYLNKFKYKYLLLNDYIDFTDKSDKIEIAKDILKFLRVTNPSAVYEIDTPNFYKSANNKSELLLLWLEKCYRKTLKQNVNSYNIHNISILISYVSECAKKGVFDEKKLVSKFNELGIYLVIEDDIPGSKIRGSFKVHNGKPAIYITRKHKRIADIYFALLHELAHCKTDFNKAQSTNLVSCEENTNEIEQARDKQALNWMVNDDYYMNTYKSKKKIDLTDEKIYPKSFIVYRMALDKLINYNSPEYQKYNKIVIFD